MRAQAAQQHNGAGSLAGAVMDVLSSSQLAFPLLYSGYYANFMQISI
jgi:hypothetical protein